MPVGVPDDYSVDQAILQEKFNSYSNFPIEIGYIEFVKRLDGENKRFAAIYIPPSHEKMSFSLNFFKNRYEIQANE